MRTARGRTTIGARSGRCSCSSPGTGSSSRTASVLRCRNRFTPFGSDPQVMLPLVQMPRPHEVPTTCAVSGVVFVLALFSVGSPFVEVIIFAAWGLMYLIECLVRGNFRRRAPQDVTPAPQLSENAATR